MFRVVALLLTILTGFSGLVYEVTWQRYLATLLGSHSEATAAVLGIFLGGLAVGYAVFGRVTRRMIARRGPEAPLLGMYGILEAAIGVWALAFPYVFGGAAAASAQLGPESDPLAFAFDVLLTILLIGPPTVLMGSTIPVLTQALPANLEEATRVHAWVYAFNTLGAFAGALAGGFVLVPLLGLDGVMRATAAVNLGAGLLFLLMQRLRRGRGVAPVAEGGADVEAGRFALLALVALLAGFAMMALQTVFNRVGALAYGASQFTFASIVACFVLCIALGSFAVSALGSIPRWLLPGSQWLLVLVLFGLYLVIPDAGFGVHVLRALFRDLPQNFYSFQIFAFVLMLLILIVPIGLSGALLPLVFHDLRREAGGLGRAAGRLYAWNTVGSLLGAMLGGYALLLWIDLHDVYRVALGALIASATLLTVLTLRVRPLAVGMLALAGGAAALAELAPWPPERMASGLFRIRQPAPFTFAGPGALADANRQVSILFHTDDPTTTVSVKQAAAGPSGGGTRAIFTNGKSDGDLRGDYPTMAMAGLVPALFAEPVERAFVIGYGTGVTVGELAALESTREVVVAEISRGVVEAAELFEHGNLGAVANPKTRIVRSDAYRALLREKGRFDVIVSEPSNPWVAGIETLFSREFLEAARDRLTEKGVYAQWFHLYETDQDTVELVLRTYDQVFEHVSIWFTFGPDIILLGFQSEEASRDLETIVRSYARPEFRRAFERCRIRSLEELLAHEVTPVDVLAESGLEGPIHTLRDPLLSHQAARAFFLGGRAEVPRLVTPSAAEVGAANSILARHLATQEGGLDTARWADVARHICDRHRPIECAAWVAYGQHRWPGSEALAEVRAKAIQTYQAQHGEFSLRELAELAALFGSQERGSTVAAARAATERFARFYHHAIPFDRAVVDRAWNGCRGNKGCATGRAWAERTIGALGR